jgi:hypothetical protein
MSSAVAAASASGTLRFSFFFGAGLGMTGRTSQGKLVNKVKVWFW